MEVKFEKNLIRDSIDPISYYFWSTLLIAIADLGIPLRLSKKKPKFRNVQLLSYLLIWTPIIIIPLAFIVAIIGVYFEGGYNYLRSRSKFTDAFHTINYTIIGILTLYKLFS